MNLEYIEQVPPGNPPQTLEYNVQDDILTVTHKINKVENDEIVVDQEVTDIFDFTGTPDGEIDLENTQTSLNFMPILAAKRENGILTVTVLDWT